MAAMVVERKRRLYAPFLTPARVSIDPKSIGHTPSRALQTPPPPVRISPAAVFLDTVTDTETQNAVYDILAPSGAITMTAPYDNIEKSKLSEDKFITHVNVMASDHRQLALSLYSKLTELLANGEVKVSLSLNYENMQT